MVRALGVTIGDGFHIPKKHAKLVKRELDKIEKACGGHYESSDVTDAVRPWDPKSKHPLKRFYPKSAKDAARMGYDMVSGQLIRSVRLLIEFEGESEPRDYRAFLYTEKGYSGTARILKEDENSAAARAAQVEKARADLAGWYERWKDWSELNAELRAVASVVAVVEKKVDPPK